MNQNILTLALFLSLMTLLTSCGKRNQKTKACPPKLPGPIGKVITVSSAAYQIYEAIVE